VYKNNNDRGSNFALEHFFLPQLKPVSSSSADVTVR
jgi:hypothetical protein